MLSCLLVSREESLFGLNLSDHFPLHAILIKISYFDCLRSLFNVRVHFRHHLELSLLSVLLWLGVLGAFLEILLENLSTFGVIIARVIEFMYHS